MFGIFKPKPLLDEDSTLWLFDAFAWSLRNFDAEVFFHEAILVTPSNKHFPGRESSAQGMANLIFEQVKNYAGLKHWPCHVVDANSGIDANKTQPRIESPLRGSKSAAVDTVDESNKLIIPYNPSQLAKPEALIASYAHILGHYLGQTASEPPPGGEQFWPQATELLAVFMGFGLMIANSAYTFRGSCGSCYNPLAERSASLSQDEATYALAVFCCLKNIPNRDVLPHLKSYLRPIFKTAVREIKNVRNEDLARLGRKHNIDDKEPNKPKSLSP